ncbi:MAG: FAD-dependent oxidoreductase [Pseudomonadota bacterium]
MKDASALRAETGCLILGGGLAGLAAGWALTQAGRRVQVLEGAETVGGLARTVVRDGFRFDLGGHRFFTHDARVDGLVRELLGDELVMVPRASRICLRGKWIEYPLRPLGALFGLGACASAQILLGYATASIASWLRPTPLTSLEDWVVAHFGRPLFELYFRGYSEKVWGVGCRDISAEWMAQRVQGLSLGTAIRHAFLKRGAALPTLADRFLYPRLGIGRIAECLRAAIERSGSLATGTRVVRMRHDGRRIKSVTVRRGDQEHELLGEAFLSTIPLTQVIRALSPHAPLEVRAAAARLRYRDLVIVTVMFERERATDQTWIYFPGKDIPFGRLHEPTNWSAAMAPPGCTLLVTERFCFRGDASWNASDAELIETTVHHLETLGFIRRQEVRDGMVVRIPAAYPLFEVGYQERTQILCDYLGRFDNMQLAGRSGLFRYYNMDQAIASGLAAAEAQLVRNTPMPAAAAVGGVR